MIEQFFDIGRDMLALDEKVMGLCRPYFERIDDISRYNRLKVHAAFIKNNISAQHLTGTTGYGYDDKGRDGLDRLFADIMGAEDGLCRHNFASGTHTLTVALFGMLRPGDKMVAVTGRPYDTLQPVIGLDGSHYGSLMDYGVLYDECDLKDDFTPDIRAIKEKCKDARMCYIQRSRGYSLRRALSLEDIKLISDAVKSVNPDIIVMVDNCYGEFTNKEEPIAYGADIMAGSLIKNPGGGIAPTGGYIVGRHHLVEMCAHRLTAPGTGREIGCSLDVLRQMYLGIYFAPTVTANALKSSVYASCLFENMGFDVLPGYTEPRNDIVTSIFAENAENLIAMCHGIQAASPVDSFAAPEPGDMPGYTDQIIMAAGAFTMGSSIELSCDAPLRPPFVAYMQGGLVFDSARGAILYSARQVKKVSDK